MSAQRKVVIRNGQRKILWKCPSGYKKAEAGSRQCQRRGAGDLMKIKRRAKRSARKRKQKVATINRKRKFANRKRKTYNLKRYKTK